MIISVNWLKQYTDIDLSIDDLVEVIGARIVEIEEVTDIGAKYKGIVVAKVVSAEKLEDTDHLNLVKIDDGKAVKDVERDKDGLVQVVCGASNVRAGIFVAWLPPGATVPSTFNDDEPFVLSKKELKGIVSNGMIASEKELDLSDEHAGIMEIPESIPGKSFASVYKLDDYLLDIENKSLTHRPDTFGVIGFAREVAAVQGKDFVTPDWLAETDPVITGTDEVKIKVSIDDTTLSDRYQAVVLENVSSAKEVFPLMPTFLARSGLRPISPVVDVTNYLMLETGQPLHAFDYDKLLKVGDGKIDIHVRAGRLGEKLKLLDGRVAELNTEDIVIANGNIAVALAGAMGGSDTEIDSSTKRILIESATFNLYRLRGTQMRHGIFSEAITRFTKGQPAYLTAPVLAQAIDLLKGLTDAKVISSMAEAVGKSEKPKSIKITTEGVNNLLGTSMSQIEIQKTLSNIEFSVVEDGQDELIVSAPYWRADIHIAEDIVEEVGRLQGFDSINPTLPKRSFEAVSVSKFDEFRKLVADVLTRTGASEVLTYSFVHGDILKKAGQIEENSYRIVNSISPDLQYYRQSLTPSLLTLVHPNIKQGFDQFAVYEINKVHPKSLGFNAEKIPVEQDSVGFVVASKTPKTGSAYYEARVFVDYLSKALGVKLNYETIDKKLDAKYSVFEPKRSAHITTDGNVVGVVGEYKESVSRGFKLPRYIAGFEIDSQALFEAYQNKPINYKPISKYPGTDRDICFRVKQDVSHGEVEAALFDGLKKVTDLNYTIEPIDVYAKSVQGDKNITLRINLNSDTHTLSGDEVGDIIAKVSKIVVTATDATVV